ncbi:hypothetical protein OAG39_01610 [Verrucomicrobiales bacterium]|nr:hypothetical protein [Verrucomicrobiales bacterium]
MAIWHPRSWPVDFDDGFINTLTTNIGTDLWLPVIFISILISLEVSSGKGSRMHSSL